MLKSIRFCFIDVRWLLTAFDFQILKTTTCTLSYKTLKILSTFCSLVWKIRENLKILFSKIWPDRTDSCNIMCIWVKSPGEFKNLDLSKVNEHRTSSSLLESLKLSCTATIYQIFILNLLNNDTYSIKSGQIHLSMLLPHHFLYQIVLRQQKRDWCFCKVLANVEF